MFEKTIVHVLDRTLIGAATDIRSSSEEFINIENMFSDGVERIAGSLSRAQALGEGVQALNSSSFSALFGKLSLQTPKSHGISISDSSNQISTSSPLTATPLSRAFVSDNNLRVVLPREVLESVGASDTENRGNISLVSLTFSREASQLLTRRFLQHSVPASMGPHVFATPVFRISLVVSFLVFPHHRIVT